MNGALWLLALQGVLGAFDTLYYHEWRAKLPTLGRLSHAELRLHALRDFIYAAIFITLPLLAWQGGWAVALMTLLAAEIIATMADFVVEDRVRSPLGGLYPGERITHGIMGIVYGAMLACLLPVVLECWKGPTGLILAKHGHPVLRRTLIIMGIGVFLSGLRDLGSVLGLPHSDWPWGKLKATEAKVGSPRG
jgi:hypothetical protein